jgi:hypothetical protein
VIQSTKMVPSGIKIGKEQLNILTYADDIVLIGKKWNRNTTFCRNGKHCKKVRTTHKPKESKMYDSGMENQFKIK